MVMYIKNKDIMASTFKVYIFIISIAQYVIIWKLVIKSLSPTHIGTYYGSLQEKFVQNVASIIFCRKSCMWFGHMVDVMSTWIPWASMDEYIDKIKNNNDAPCQWVIWWFDPP